MYAGQRLHHLLALKLRKLEAVGGISGNYLGPDTWTDIMIDFAQILNPFLSVPIDAYVNASILLKIFDYQPTH